MKRRRQWLIHLVLLIFLALTMTPFAFVLNNSLRTNTEWYHQFFGLPRSLSDMAAFTAHAVSGQHDKIQLRIADSVEDESNVRAADWKLRQMSYSEAMGRLWETLTRGWEFAWKRLRLYMVNTLFVVSATLGGVLLIGSLGAYVLARYRFPGRQFLYMILLSIIMIPGVLTLVPSFLLVKKLGLLNSYWVLILPYIAGGQILAIFLFKGFFEGLPEDLFESARIDGAGHFANYRHIVLPLSKQIFAVVAVMNILDTWNNFLWPFITNSDARYHVVSSGLYLMAMSPAALNFSTMYAAYIIASVPLILLFIYATRPFMQGVTSGAFKA